MFAKFGSTSSHASQKFNRLIVQGMIQNGCKADTITQRIPISVDEEEKQRPEEEEQGIHFKYLPCYHNKLFNRIMMVLNARREILKWNRSHKDGIIICDIILGELSIALWMASWFRRINSVAIVTDVPSIRAGEKRKGIKAIPFMIKNATIRNYHGYIFLTEQMNMALNPKHKPYVVIEGVVDPHVLDEPNTMEGKHALKVCMMAGLLEDIFGVSDLIEAFMQVDVPDARLVFYGKGSSVEKILEAQKLDSRICYLGELKNTQIVSEEKKATLLINPRPPVGEWTAYSFPSKNMEYIASGTPMLAYYLPCIPDEYMPHSFYLFADRGEQGNMLQTLKKVLQKDREELYIFGKEAQMWIVENKNPEIQTRKAVDMMRQIATQK